MSKEYKRYLTREKLKEDTSQYKFNVNGNLDKPLNNKKNKKINLTETVYCPFCLYKARLQRFLTSSKEGISTYKAQCPDCGKGMLMRTISAMCGMNDTKIRQYAEWCFMYRLSGFWSKVKIEVFNRRLKEYGWSITFWSKYRELKGTVVQEEWDE